MKIRNQVETPIKTNRLSIDRKIMTTPAVIWRKNNVILLIALFSIVIILRIDGFAKSTIAIVAIAGLVLNWFLGMNQKRKFYKPLNQNNSPWYQELGAKGKQRRQEQYPLTTRETVILNYIAHGYINKEIGYMLGISHQTVKNHVTNILLKLNVTDRTRAVVLAIQNGWILASDLE